MVGMRLTRAVLAAVLVVALVPATASAKPDESVDCEQLELTDQAFFPGAAALLEELGIGNFGQFVSFMQRNPEVFAEAGAGFTFVSGFFGDPIVFTSMTQAVTTHAKCGLHPLVPWLVNGFPPGQQ